MFSSSRSASVGTLLISIGSLLHPQSVVGQTGAPTASPTTGTAVGPNTGATSGASSGGSANPLAAGLSSQCQAAAGSLLTSEFSSCSNVIGLVSVIGAQGSVISPLNTWITGICSSSPCSASTLSAASSTINAGCGDDVQKNVPSAVALSNLISNYDAARNLLCTQYTGNSTFCVPAVLGDIQTATGKNISLNEVQTLVTSGMAAMSLSSIPPGAYCTDCGHALLTQSAAISVKTGSTSNATTASTGANSALGSVCGASFADGKLPSTVRVAGNGKASSNAKQNGAAQERVSILNMAILALLGLAGVCLV